MKRNNKKKNREHRKFVRKQKQLIRARRRKHKPRKWFLVNIQLEEGVTEKVRELARRRGVSEARIIRELIKMKLESEGWHLKTR